MSTSIWNFYNDQIVNGFPTLSRFFDFNFDSSNINGYGQPYLVFFEKQDQACIYLNFFFIQLNFLLHLTI